jgi:glucose/arabinose dehydrogenase
MNSCKMTFSTALALGLAACGGGQQADEPAASSQTAAPEAAAPATAPDTGIELPEGFTATIFADGLSRPRHIAVRDNGDVYIALRAAGGPGQADQGSGGGGIMALRDEDGDGQADTMQRFGRSDVHTGVAIHDGRLYYSSATAIYAVDLDPDQLAPTGEPVVVASGFGESGGHAAKPITFDGSGHLYTQAGTPSNACQEQSRTPGSPGQDPCPQLESYGGVWQFDADGRDQDQMRDGVHYSTGHRNAVALEWNPTVDKLYLAMNGRDQLDDLWSEHYTLEDRLELPAEEFHVVEQGDNLGWPYTYYDPIRGERMVQPEYGGDGETAAEPGKYKDPLIGFPAHWAPVDLLFYTADQFPERYRNGAFIAFHGSWNRQGGDQGGYCVVFVPMQDGRPSGDWEIFADDFEGPDPIQSPASAAHRPVGLAVGPDGALYVTDDTAGRVWKITYQGQ